MPGLLDRVLKKYPDRDAANGGALTPRSDKRVVVMSLLTAAALLLLGDAAPVLSMGLAGLVGILLLKTSIEASRSVEA